MKYICFDPECQDRRIITARVPEVSFANQEVAEQYLDKHNADSVILHQGAWFFLQHFVSASWIEIPNTHSVARIPPVIVVDGFIDE